MGSEQLRDALVFGVGRVEGRFGGAERMVARAALGCMRGGSVMRHMGWGWEDAGVGVLGGREGMEGGVWSMKTRDGFFPAGDEMVVEGVGGVGEGSEGNTWFIPDRS